MDVFWPGFGVGVGALILSVIIWCVRDSFADLNRDLLRGLPGPSEMVRRSSTPRTFGSIALFGAVFGLLIIILSFFPSRWG